MDSGLGSASGGASTSIGSSSPRRNGAEGTTPLRASSPPPVVVTDTICIPGWLTFLDIYPYKYKSRLLKP